MTRAAEIVCAIQDGNVVLMTEILNSGIDVDTIEDGNTLLEWCVLSENKEALDILLARGADVDLIAGSDLGALGYSLMYSDGIMLDRLIQHGSNLKRRNGHGLTLLMMAVAGSTSDIILKIIELGAELGATSRYGTALHCACRAGNADAVKILLDRGLLVSAVDDNLRTPIHSAVYSGDFAEIVKILIEHGARVDSLDDDGNTPLVAAQLMRHEACIKIIESIGTG
jgi:ankyrin repeat protein